MNAANEQKTCAAIELTLLPGVGPVTQNRIWEALRGEADLSVISNIPPEVLGVSSEAVAQIRSRRHRDRSAEIFEWGLRESCRFLVKGVAGYPSLLEEIADPPLVLYARGSLEALTAPCTAVVGTRKPTIYGLQMARSIASDLSERGITVVSGMARGIDGAAHRGCLDGNGKTIAVLGCGIDTAYPREHRKLSQLIQENGLLLSEFVPGTVPTPHNFPLRNRIISGISLAVLIVEASERSGSLITARLALEQNREVFAIPGNLTVPQSFGSNYLIKQGAKLIQSWRDVVEELPGEFRQAVFQKEDAQLHCTRHLDVLSEEEERIIKMLQTDEAIHFDKIYHNSNIEISRLSSLLLTLEMRGFIRHMPGNLYIRLNK